MWLEFEEYDELTFCELRLTHTHINSNGIIQFLIFGCRKEPPLRKLFNSLLTRYTLLSMQFQLLRQWDKIHSNEASWAVFFHGTIFTTLTSNAWVFRYLLYDFVHGSHSKIQGVEITVPKMNEQDHKGNPVVINIQNVGFF